IRVGSGTLGCLVEDDFGSVFLLSCAHVLSDAAGVLGDPIVQPGTAFGGRPLRDTVATVNRCLQLNTGPSIADAGIARIDHPSLVTSAIRYVGAPPRGTRILRAGDLGLKLRKS